MFWVLQNNLFNEVGFQSLVGTLERMSIKHTIVKVVPFVGEIIPNINPRNPVIAIGAYSMWKVARRKDGSQVSL